MTRPAMALAAMIALAGCGSGDGPVLTSLELRGQLPQQPLVLELVIGFEHPTGELGLGSLHLFIDGEEKNELSMSEVFRAQSPEIGLGAMEGMFRVQVELDGPVAAGREIEIGLFVVDRLGVESNEPTITLRALSASEGES